MPWQLSCHRILTIILTVNMATIHKNGFHNVLNFGKWKSLNMSISKAAMNMPTLAMLLHHRKIYIEMKNIIIHFKHDMMIFSYNSIGNHNGWIAIACMGLNIWSSLHPDSKVHGPTWGPPGSSPPQMGPMLVPWTLLSGWFLGAKQTIWHNLNQCCLINHLTLRSRFFGSQIKT